MSRFTDQTTQPAIKRQTNDGPVRNPAYEGFQRLVLEIVKDLNFGGIGGVTAAQIVDASPSGRAVLVSSPGDARVALELGTAATKAVGSPGGVAAYDDPRFSSGGGGSGAPSTVTASQISDGSNSGRLVLTGTPLQGRSALEFAGIQSTNAAPPWTVGKGSFDRMRVSVGSITPDYYPGGGIELGAYSAITGTLELPASSDAAVDSSGNPLIIISAGVSGLVQTKAAKNVAVALFGNARVDADNGRVWGANVVTANFASSYTVPQYGRPAQINGIEIDCTWKATQNPTTGSNQIAIWIPAEFYGGRPDGAADAIRIGCYGDFGHKNFLSADHGSADRFADLGMSIKETVAGAKGGQGIRWITSKGGQKTGSGDTNQYVFSHFEVSPTGDMIMQPDYYGGGGAFIVANSNLTQAHSIHPVNGFSGARATVGTLGVTGSASVNGNVTAGSMNTGSLNTSGAAGVGGNLSVNGSTTSGNLFTGGIACSGNGAFGSLTYQGTAVQLSPYGTVPGNAKALIVVV